MTDDLNPQWYNADDSFQAAEIVVSVVKDMADRQGAQRLALAEDSLALYLGSARHSLSGSGNALAMLDLIGQESSAYNLIQAITDTKINATLKNQVRTMFITESADSETKRKASDMQSACDGINYKVGMRGWLRRAKCVAGFLFEAGGVEWFADVANKRVQAYPVWCWEYFVSNREARYGKPPQLFAKHAIDRAVLASYVSNASKAIRDAVANAPPATGRDAYDDMRDSRRISDQVIVYKAWHLPSGAVDLEDPGAYGLNEDGRKVKPSHDGRHVVAIEAGHASGANVALIDVPWPDDHFPVSWFKPNPVPASYWSRGEPEVLAAAQIELNKWNNRSAKIVDLLAVPRTFVDKKSGLNPAQMTNAPNNIYLTNGSPSQAVFVANNGALPPDLMERLQAIPQWARDQRGMSEMSMAARKPIGVNHEPGMQYLADTETTRHTSEFESWEDSSLEDSKNIIRCLRTLAKHHANFEVVLSDSKQFRRTRWADIDLGNTFDMKMSPTNWLKDDPAERADQIMDLIDRGILPPESAIDAIEDPDIKQLLSGRIAMQKNIERCLDRVCEGSGPLSDTEYPSPLMDLQKAKLLGIVRYNELAAEEEDWQAVLRVTQWVEAVDLMIQKATPAAANQQGQGNTLSAVGPGAAAPPPPGPNGPMPPPGAAPPVAA